MLAITGQRDRASTTDAFQRWRLAAFLELPGQQLVRQGPAGRDELGRLWATWPPPAKLHGPDPANAAAAAASTTATDGSRGMLTPAVSGGRAISTRGTCPLTELGSGIRLGSRGRLDGPAADRGCRGSLSARRARAMRGAEVSEIRAERGAGTACEMLVSWKGVDSGGARWELRADLRRSCRFAEAEAAWNGRSARNS
jgi:hypothetical protein